MKKWEKEILLNKTKDEISVLFRLEKTYKYALEEVKQKVAVLQAKPQTQSVIYQLKFQNALKKQLQEVYNKLYLNSYSTIDEYLKSTYEDSFFSTMYGLHKQDVPLIIPFSQDEVVQMTSVAGDGIKLSEKLYQDTWKLATITREEISRGIATGASYIAIAQTLEKRSEASYKQAKMIVSTEAHRIQEEVQYKTLQKAKEKGADVVKQWDSTLDKRTRMTHIELDGQLREIDQPFKIPSTGATAQYPGGFGIAKEDIRCRCTSLQRARWALDKSEVTKMVGDIEGIDEDKLQAMAAKLGVDPSDLKNAQNNYIKAKNYNEFKKKYQTKAKAQQAKQAAQSQVQAQSLKRFDADSVMKNAKHFDDMNKADDYYTKNVWNSVEKNLSQNEKSALNDYTGESSYSYRAMNTALRKKNISSAPQKVQDNVKYATTAIEKSLLPEDVQVRRGLRGGASSFCDWFELDLSKLADANYQKTLIGKRKPDLGFVSCGVADGAGFSGFNLEIYCPKGTQAIYLEPISQFKGGSEKELLIQRNTTFEIKRIDTDSRGYIQNVVLLVVEQSH